MRMRDRIADVDETENPVEVLYENAQRHRQLSVTAYLTG
jgi:hypothetical protein